MSAVYLWTIEVRTWNTYGDRVTTRVPAVIRAESRAEVTTKVRDAFGAQYDNFRGFWSHDWVLVSMAETTPADDASEVTP